MKSIYDIRRENLKEIIRAEFDNRQVRLAERMQVQPNLINRWCSGAKNIGANAARQIETFGRKQQYWLDVDHSAEIIKDSHAKNDDEWTIEQLVSSRLRSWMDRRDDLGTEGRVASASGVSQSTINRLLKCEASATIGVIAAVASAFGRHAYEMVLPDNAAGMIDYDHSVYAALPQEEKAKITSFIEFVFAQNAPR